MDLNVLPQSKWQELARFTWEEMQGKAIKKLPVAKSMFQWEPDHSPPMDTGFAEEGLPNEEEGSLPEEPGSFGRKETYPMVTRSSLLSGLSNASKEYTPAESTNTRHALIHMVTSKPMV
jgi:hypothetical protein